MFEGRMVLLLPWILMFVVGFVASLIITYMYKKKAKKGEMDWQKYERARSNFTVALVVGAVFASIGLYALATNVGVLEIFLGERANRVGDLVVTAIVFFFGPGILGTGLGFGLGSLIFPVKNPQKIYKNSSS